MICQFCNYKHDNEGDLYGCPNCEGKQVKSKAELMKETRERRKQAGLACVEVYIHPEKRTELSKAVKSLGGIYDNRKDKQ